MVEVSFDVNALERGIEVLVDEDEVGVNIYAPIFSKSQPDKVTLIGLRVDL